MNIPINKDYRIEADNNNIILRKRKIVTKSKDETKIGTEYWDDDGYYNTLESLFFGLVRRKIIASDATSLQELVSEVKALSELIKEVGSDILPKDIQRICEERK